MRWCLATGTIVEVDPQYFTAFQVELTDLDVHGAVTAEAGELTGHSLECVIGWLGEVRTDALGFGQDTHIPGQLFYAAIRDALPEFGMSLLKRTKGVHLGGIVGKEIGRDDEAKDEGDWDEGEGECPASPPGTRVAFAAFGCADAKIPPARRLRVPSSFRRSSAADGLSFDRWGEPGHLSSAPCPAH